jgi:hypothetical protein
MIQAGIRLIGFFKLFRPRGASEDPVTQQFHFRFGERIRIRRHLLVLVGRGNSADKFALIRFTVNEDRSEVPSFFDTFKSVES